MAQHAGVRSGTANKRSTATKRKTSRKDTQPREERDERLSGSTRSMKWTSSVDEHEDYPGQTLATRNHEVIRRWAEERKGNPATAGSNDPEHPRVLRIDFPPYGEGLQDIDWDAWFRTFDERNLVFLFQEHLRNGRQSNFFKLDNPES